MSSWLALCWGVYGFSSLVCRGLHSPPLHPSRWIKGTGICCHLSCSKCLYRLPGFHRCLSLLCEILNPPTPNSSVTVTLLRDCHVFSLWSITIAGVPGFSYSVPVWFSLSHTHRHHTLFLLIAKKSDNLIESIQRAPIEQETVIGCGRCPWRLVSQDSGYRISVDRAWRGPVDSFNKITHNYKL